MKNYHIGFLVGLLPILFLSALGQAQAHESSYRYEDDYSRSNYGIQCRFSSVSVGVGTLSNGVVVTIDSFDSEVTQCIKNSSWLSYFNAYGNNVSIDVSNTSLGIQITATSSDRDTATNLQNAQWSRIITGRPTTYILSEYTKTPVRSTKRYTPRRKVVRSRDDTYISQQYNYNYYSNSTYTPPTRTYKAGSSLFNTREMFRSISYLSNGTKMTFSSPDYNTMRTLQSYYFTGLYSDFSGISVSVVHISGGVEVTVTSGNTSTVEQIQKIGYALIYN